MEESRISDKATEQQDLFIEGEFVEYTEASILQRFLNYLIDTLLMRFGLSWATTYLLVTFLLATSPKTAYALFSEDGSPLLAASVIAMLNHLI